MSDRTTIGLDNPVFRGRLRQPDSTRLSNDRVTNQSANRPTGRYISEINGTEQTPPSAQPRPEPPSQPAFPRPRMILPATPQSPQPSLPIVRPQPFAEPAQPRQQHSSVLKRYAVPFPKQTTTKKSFKNLFRFRLSKLQFSLVGMAVVVFIIGVVVNVQTIKTNHQAAAQVAALAKKAANANGAGDAAVISTVKPSAAAIRQYVVAPNLPRYLKIPKLGVNARVLQVGLTASGAIGTPNNVYDTAWYLGSAEPGQTGATVIDGHVSSWTTKGIFYNLKKLVPGDSIQIVRGDGTVFNYQVVRTQAYNVKSVNMHAAITPVTSGKSGLNLITCTGDVLKGGGGYSQRLIVFAQQV